MIDVEQSGGDAVRLRLDREEAEVLRKLVDEMLTLLHEEESDDPVTKRLFPDAYDSPDDAAAYRELVSNQLRASKISSLKAVRNDLADDEIDVTLSGEAAGAWLTAITDLRLALGTRLEMTEEKMAQEIDPQDPHASSYAILHWLGWIQESMLHAMNP
jgi:hypothetical protein